MAKLKSGTRIYGTATIDTSVVVGSAVTASSSGIQVTGVSTLGTVRISSGIVTATTGIVTYYGDGSQLSNIISGVSISTNTTNQNQFIPYAIGTGSTTGFGVSTTGLVFNPSTGNLGIGITNPTSRLTVTGSGTSTSQLIVSGFSTFAGITTVTGPILFTTQLSVAGVATLSNLRVIPTGIGATVGGIGVGVVTYYGDGSQLSGISATVDGQDFNVGITSAVSVILDALGSNVLTLPSTVGSQYIIYSIHATNIAIGNTEVNVIGAFDINSTSERSYFSYNIPIPTGTAVELLKQPQVLNPSDKIVMRSTDYSRSGIGTAVHVHITYQQKTSSSYFGIGIGSVSIASTSITPVYTATSASVIQSIRLTNKTDSGPYPISVLITSGITTINLIDNLIVPKYANVEILDTQKRLNTNDILSVQADQWNTIDVQVSGRRI